MLTRELLADALQGVDAGSVLHDRANAEHVADFCLGLFASQAQVAAHIRLTGDPRPPTLRDAVAANSADVPDVRVYDSAAYQHARRAGAIPAPLPLRAIGVRARARRSIPGDAA